MSDETKVIAFYLPQFHPVAENDAWWGRGFTEWTNVAAATPLFAGHYQPHIPAGLGFYDLRVPEVREQQAALARRHGIDGFMYYHYWFEGQRLLDRTFEEVLRSGRPDFPFALLWANENWTRTWDGGGHRVLIEQRYDEEEAGQHIAWLVSAFKDPRYITIGRRPLFAIYRVQSLPSSTTFLRDLRAACLSAGVADPYIVKFDTRANYDDPARHGCDAAAQFPPHGFGQLFPGTRVSRSAGPRHRYVDYGQVVDVYSELPAPAWTRHECVFPGWDNSPRRREQAAIVVHDSSPDLYESWLRTVCHRAPERGGIVFINAWNEWAEGAHLEPDMKWGDAFLRATARVVLGSEPAPPADDDGDGVLIGPTFAELYLDIYERYVCARRRLTSTEEAIRREVDRRTQLLREQLNEECARNEKLAGLIEAMLAERSGASARGADRGL